MSAVKGRATGLLAVAMIATSLVACASPQPLDSPSASETPPQAAPISAAATGRPRVPGLKELTGMHQAEIVAMLGMPDLKRSEAPAELWQYRAADCVLTLFFYRGPGGFRLTRAETWERSLAGSSTPAQCRDESAPLRAHLVSLQSAL